LNWAPKSGHYKKCPLFLYIKYSYNK